MAESPQSQPAFGATRTAGSWSPPGPILLSVPETSSLDYWSCPLLLLDILLGTEGMSLVHLGAGFGRSSEGGHLTCYYCCLSLG